MDASIEDLWKQNVSVVCLGFCFAININSVINISERSVPHQSLSDTCEL